jgi:hypothetical protein
MIFWLQDNGQLGHLTAFLWSTVVRVVEHGDLIHLGLSRPVDKPRGHIGRLCHLLTGGEISPSRGQLWSNTIERIRAGIGILESLNRRP